MKKIIDVSKEDMPDCCISCQELNVEDGTLACNFDGCDTLPFKKCSEFKRLKYYGVYKQQFDIAI